MTEQNKILDAAIATLDISPTDFEAAKSRYSAVGDWLDRGCYGEDVTADIYLQGSFRLGTVVRPYRNKGDADYDIDQVCELVDSTHNAEGLKGAIGDRLRDNSEYDRMLDEEGRRCWTLSYASSEGHPGFHLDVLPSRPAGIGDAIKITHKDGSDYTWRPSNPKGYYQWFKGKNSISQELLMEQRTQILKSNETVYASVDEVPKQLVRTALQRSIQLMKRHRDVMFDGKPERPISIIITTICTHLYRHHDILETVRTFVDYVIARHQTVVAGEALPQDGVLDYINGEWVIPNPADKNENFADRWAEEKSRAQAFFAWVYQLRHILYVFGTSGDPNDLALALRGVEGKAENASDILVRFMDEGKVRNDDRFLELIHMAVDGRLPWPNVKRLAERNVREEHDSTNKDIARINLLQVKRHSGEDLSWHDREEVRQIMGRHPVCDIFRFCGNLLLDTADARMLRACMAARGDYKVLSWPIVRLAGELEGMELWAVPYLDRLCSDPNASRA